LERLAVVSEYNVRLPNSLQVWFLISQLSLPVKRVF